MSKTSVYFICSILLCFSSCKEIITSCIEIKQKPSEIKTGIAVEFNGYCSQNAETYQWLISDTYSYTGAKITHTFDPSSVGKQVVKLTITGKGEVISRSIQVNVLP